jgi:3-oxoacyl-[acyl-carrier-protein] synthase-1
VPAGRLDILEASVPYGFAADPALPCLERLKAGLDAAGADLDLGSLSPDAPVFLGSSSLLVGLLEEGAWPRPLDQGLPRDPLDEAVMAHWGLPTRPWVFSTSCTSAVHALDAAVRSIACGACEEALVVGIEVLNRFTASGFLSLRLLSPTGSRPLDPERDGLVLGEAVGALRLSATPSPWRIHPPALALDVNSPTSYTPDGSTLAGVMRQALDQAGIAPGQVRGVKLQAAGSPGTDAVEALGLRQVFGDALPPLTSLKAALGHTLGACGAAELAAMLACAAIPPTAGFQQVDPALGLRPAAAPWLDGPVLMNIQGFGGSLASWVLERR